MPEHDVEELHRIVTEIGELAADADLRVAVGESLTSGAVAVRLGAGPGASTWFAGGVVAYQEAVKFEVLGVPEGPVVTPECAREMAAGVRRLMSADLAVAVTGVGGPEPSEGKPPGTVYLAVESPTAVGAGVEELRFDGGPDEVLDETVRAALVALRDAVRAVAATGT